MKFFRSSHIFQDSFQDIFWNGFPENYIEYWNTWIAKYLLINSKKQNWNPVKIYSHHLLPLIHLLWQCEHLGQLYIAHSSGWTYWETALGLMDCLKTHWVCLKRWEMFTVLAQFCPYFETTKVIKHLSVVNSSTFIMMKFSLHLYLKKIKLVIWRVIYNGIKDESENFFFDSRD